LGRERKKKSKPLFFSIARVEGGEKKNQGDGTGKKRAGGPQKKDKAGKLEGSPLLLPKRKRRR